MSNATLKGIVFRDQDGSGREGIMIGDTIVRLFGKFDCMYQSTNLVKVHTKKWTGQSPKLPLQYLGFIEGENVDKALAKSGETWGTGSYHSD